jgi:nitrous oxidase accessory protein NosD
VRGGTYTGQGGYDWTIGASGTPSAPILLAAYPGEVPLFDGQGAFSHWLIIHQAHDIIVRGFIAQNYSRGPTGDAVVLVFDGAANIVIEQNTLQNSGLDILDHGVYVGANAGNITVRNNVIRGITGWGVTLYHDPGPNGMFVYGNTITNNYGGVIFASNGTNGTIQNNVFSGVQCSIEWQPQFTNVVISGNSPSDATCDIP